MKTDEYINQTVDTALEVFLLLCVPEFEPMTEPEIAQTTGLSRNKVYRIMRSLEHKRFVRKSRNKWMASPDIVKIADGFRRHIARQRAELEELEGQYLQR